MNNYIDIKETILNKIKEYNSIIIVRHFRPDGDCMGSAIGLREILRESYPEKHVYAVGKDKSDYLDFLGQSDEPLTEDVYKESLIIALDTATQNRISDDSYTLGKELIKIDHHINVEDYGSINYVREDFPACATIIMDFYDTFKDQLKINIMAAQALYIGVSTDTGRFKYSGVNGRVMKLAGDMIDLGIDIEKLYANLYIKDQISFKLQGYIYNHFKTTSNGVAYIYFSRRTQKRFGVNPSDASALVNTLDSIEGKLIWIIFVQQKDGKIRARIRSRFVSIVEIAEQFNGGGHKQASGATVYNKKELKKLVNMADQILFNFKQENPEVK